MFEKAFEINKWIGLAGEGLSRLGDLRYGRLAACGTEEVRCRGNADCPSGISSGGFGAREPTSI